MYIAMVLAFVGLLKFRPKNTKIDMFKTHDKKFYKIPFWKCFDPRLMSNLRVKRNFQN